MRRDWSSGLQECNAGYCETREEMKAKHQRKMHAQGAGVADPVPHAVVVVLLGAHDGIALRELRAETVADDDDLLHAGVDFGVEEAVDELVHAVRCEVKGEGGRLSAEVKCDGGH